MADIIVINHLGEYNEFLSEFCSSDEIDMYIVSNSGYRTEKFEEYTPKAFPITIISSMTEGCRKDYYDVFIVEKNK